MPASTTTSWNSRLMLRVGAISAALAVAATVAVASGSDPVGPAAPAAATTVASPTATPTTSSTSTTTAAPRQAALTVPQTTPATFFRPATFNVLGADHTAPGGNRKGWDSGVVRIERVVQIIQQNSVDVVGFQEFQPPQALRFQELTGTSWQTYPGANNAAGPSVNSIAWRTDVWQLLESRTLPIPYFDGVPSRMPAVLLQNIETGRRVWFFNTHNPADVRGPAQQWRDAGFAMEAALANELRTTYPDAPFISFGDKNDRARYYCSVAPVADMWSASGGYVDGGTCSAPTGGAIDWIMGTKNVFFNGYTRYWNDFVAQTSDHPLYYANAVVPASRPAGVDHVVVVAVPGLTSTVVRKMGTQLSELDRMVQGGASTRNARTAAESTSPDAGIVSLLTGRRVFPKRGGHGVGSKPTLPRTVHDSAGQYVSSVFDLAHNMSRRTSFVSSRPQSKLVRESWNKKSGGKDPYGVDDGTAKFDQVKTLRDDAAVVGWWKGKMSSSPAALSVVELSGAERAGTASGWTSDTYEKAVKKVSRRVAAIRRGIQRQPEMNGTTLLVVTGTSGAQKTKGSSRTWVESYRVPMFITGPGVPAGADLYGLNPSRAYPGKAQVGYSGPQPIRLGDLANLVDRTLGLPPVPGSTHDPEQLFQVFDPLSVPGS
ncbi:alkaline phosphatase family protein [Nocardioides KLBMP 9356]|uniref:Alkaline phosphatase family protein n=1 Tax=Nocardioides potassii TaxID=2911371 RepID=A0ABS9HHW0_9ACTN|nr:alkaline phosphatase family protein [Nocardioides potassii]MCF6379805.1 alkaline phosphatase family protein [Nocardioides potassii]